MLTLQAKRPSGWMSHFEIPHLVIRNLQWEHFEAILKDTSGIELKVPAIADGQLEMADKEKDGLTMFLTRGMRADKVQRRRAASGEEWVLRWIHCVNMTSSKVDGCRRTSA